MQFHEYKYKNRKLKFFSYEKFFENQNQNQDSGNLIIFIHGIFGSHSNFVDYLKFFEKKKVSVCAIDLLGHGKSVRIPGLKIKDLVNTVEFYIRKKIIKNFPNKNITIVGFSLGSIVSQRVAYILRNKKNIKNLILIAGFSGEPSLIANIRFFMTINSGKLMSKTFLEYLKNTYLFKKLYSQIAFSDPEHDFSEEKYIPDTIYEDIRNLSKIFRNDQEFKIKKEKINYQIINIRADNDLISMNRDFEKIMYLYQEKCRSIVMKNCGHLILNQKKKEIINIIQQQLNSK